ncbi:Omp28-related outer membrane protein [Psychroserpens sp. XS_ASV72]|uniref:Omp28-related outer membrane protein n=1 Tax=Psychroserpens sp. XS_ASV72 TaxID=3241293 RepID=UPI0035141BFD
MKVKNLSKIFLFILSAAVFSCSSSSDEDNGGNNGGPTSITVTPSAEYVDFGNTVSFTVKTNQNTDVTSEATILVNNQSIEGNSFTASATGEYTITAEYRNLTSSGVSVTVLPVIVSIDIQSEDTYNIGERIDFQVIASDNNGNTINITSGSKVFVNGAESLTGARIITNTTGSFDAYATFEEFTSNTKTVTVEDNASTPMTYTRKALIEDYTGDWCGYCTRVSHAIDLVKDNDPLDKVVVVAAHLYNGDPYQNSFGVQLANAFNVTGLPTAYINRADEWNFPEPSNVSQVTNLATGTTNNGLAIISASKDNNLSFMVSAGFGQNQNGAKLVVLLLENGLRRDQTNYYPEYYGGADPIVNFEHNHVLRHSFTNVLGNAIPGNETQANNTYRQYFDYVIPTNLNANALEIVAMIVNSNNQVLNVNKVNVGQNIGF